MIPELPKLEGWERLIDSLPEPDTLYYEEPLLSYVRQMASRLCPVLDIETGLYNPDWGADVFASRYLSGKIDTSFKEKYEESRDLLETLRGFGIDKDKFWYLILFIKDFVDVAKLCDEANLTARQKLCRLKEALLSKESKLNIEAKGKVDYNDQLVLQFLSYAIEKALPELNDLAFYNKLVEYTTGKAPKISVMEHMFDIVPQPENKPLKITQKQYLFHKFMMSFLKDYKKGSLKVYDKNITIYYDKTLLISRVIYVIGYTDKPNDTRFYDLWNESCTKQNNALKNNLRRCEDIQTDHSIYTFF